MAIFQTQFVSGFWTVIYYPISDPFFEW
jgi:hypothetical protein